VSSTGFSRALPERPERQTGSSSIPPISKRTGRRQAFSKRGCSPLSGAHKGRAELETARRHRSGWQAFDFASDAWPDERSQGRQADAATGDKGYDSDAFRKALTEKGIEPCIPLQRAMTDAPIPSSQAFASASADGL